MPGKSDLAFISISVEATTMNCDISINISKPSFDSVSILFLIFSIEFIFFFQRKNVYELHKKITEQRAKINNILKFILEKINNTFTHFIDNECEFETKLFFDKKRKPYSRDGAYSIIFYFDIYVYNIEIKDKEFFERFDTLKEGLEDLITSKDYQSEIGDEIYAILNRNLELDISDTDFYVAALFNRIKVGNVKNN